MEALISELSEGLRAQVKSLTPLMGGDISDAFILQTASEKYFCKVNRKPAAADMFACEAAGLQEIKKSKTISVPEVLAYGQLVEGGYLLLEYIEQGSGSPADQRLFGEQLAALHHTESKTFGWGENNYIGSLSQKNTHVTGNDFWPEFYWQGRIKPQLMLAVKNQYLSDSEIPENDFAIRVFNDIAGYVKPSLIHGDLWNGNYLFDTNGQPYLIDPAVYYGHHLVDISMTQLFGGFSTQFYEAYFDIMAPISEAQNDIYQWYYLLVHLNLFGRSYLPQVQNILQRYF